MEAESRGFLVSNYCLQQGWEQYWSLHLSLRICYKVHIKNLEVAEEPESVSRPEANT